MRPAETWASSLQLLLVQHHTDIRVRHPRYARHIAAEETVHGQGYIHAGLSFTGLVYAQDFLSGMDQYQGPCSLVFSTCGWR